jgi:acyl dehydratase
MKIPGSILADPDLGQVGEELPPFVVALTLQRLAMEAGANRDFALIHLDPAAARAAGAPGVFANTTFIETLFEALLRSWVGSSARIRRLRFKMSDFACVGETLRAGGRVRSRQEADGEVTVEVEVAIEGDRRGRTAEGVATVSFPIAGDGGDG